MKAKTKLTKLWSILIALVMLVGLLPTTALAAEATVTADFTSGDGSAALELLNAAKTEGVADSEWDSTTNTLTLNGVNFETTAATAVKLPAVEGGVTIVLNGVNTITGGDSESAHCYGIYAAGSLTIEGDGTLNVTCGDTTCDDNESIGICAYKGSVVIKGGTVDATGGVADGGSFGIFAYKGSMVIEGGNVKATGGTAMENGSTRGIYAYRGSVSISGGNVDATGGVADGYSFGICANEGSVVIEGGTVEATGSDASYGASASLLRKAA